MVSRGEHKGLGYVCHRYPSRHTCKRCRAVPRIQHPPPSLYADKTHPVTQHPPCTPFPPRQTDTFILTGRDVGEVERVKVRSSGTGLGAAWHLDRIDVVSSATNAQYGFPFRGWVDDKHGLEHFINRDGGAGPTTDLVDYRISVYTSDIR